MTRTISERDWKIFKELREIALQRLCEKILAEAKAEIEATTGSAHEKYLSLYKLIRTRDKDIAQTFNGLSRSSALLQIGIIHSMELLTPEEIYRFSPETLQVLELYAPLPKPKVGA